MKSSSEYFQTELKNQKDSFNRPCEDSLSTDNTGNT